MKESADTDLLAAVRAVAAGNSYLSPEVSGVILKDYRKHVTNPLDLLTSREREILQLIAEGKTNKDIAGGAGAERVYGGWPPDADHGQAEPAQRRRTGAVRGAERAG